MTAISAIRAVECEFGSETPTFEELEQRFGTEALRRVYSGSGIRNGRVAPVGARGSDLAFAAADRDGVPVTKSPGIDEAGAAH